MKRIIAAILVTMAVAIPARAQVIDPTQYTSASSSDCSTAGSCASFELPYNTPSVAFTLSGTFVATLTFEATADGINWVTTSVVSASTGTNSTTATAAGIFSVQNAGFIKVRVRCSAYTSGLTRISATKGWASAKLLSPVFTTITATQGSLDADQQAISTTATWNNAGVTFTHWKAVITDTASGAGSLPLQILGGAAGTTNLFSVSKAGNATAPGFVSATPATGYIFSAQGRIAGNGDGIFTLLNNATTDFTRLQFGGTTSSFPALAHNGAILQVKLADNSAYAEIQSLTTIFNTSIKTGNGVGVVLLSATAPTISSGFGTSPTIASNNGTAAFTINVGTGGTATTGVIGLPAATTGWNCFVQDITAQAAHTADRTTVQTASTTTTATFENQIVSTGATAGAPWAASDILRVSCFAY